MSRMRWLGLSALVVILIAVLLWMRPAGAVREAGRPGTPPVSAEEAPVFAVRAKILRALESPTELDFVDTPLRDGLRYLSDYHDIRVQADERALTDDGVAMDTPVTLSLSGVTLESALNLLLKPLQLEYLIDDGALKITTRAQERLLLERETYPLRDLLDAGFSPDELRAVLLASVRPLEWSASGVSLRIEPGDQLAVRHHPSAQRELAGTLEKLRAAMARRRRAGAASQVDPSGPVMTAEERLRLKLREPTEVDFLDTPLRDCLAYLKDHHWMQIWPDEQALTDEGVAIDTPVTLSLKGVPLETALNLLLTPLQLDYVFEDEVLKVTTRAETVEMFSAEFYSVRDLLEGGYGQGGLLEILRPWLDVKKDESGGWGNPFPGGSIVPVVPPSEKPAEERPALRLVLGDLLVVRATPRGHRQLIAALEKLRAGLGQQPADATPASPSAIETVKGNKAPAIADDAKIRRELESNTDVDFIDTPLRDALNTITDHHGIQIWPDEQALTDEGIAIDTPVTLSLAGARLDLILDRILHPLHAEYAVEEGVLKITSQVDAQKIFQLEIFPVRDLLDAGLGPDELCEALKLTVTPEAWEKSGASLRIARGNLLVVRHHPAAQRAVARALEKLRVAVAPRPAAPAAKEPPGDAAALDAESARRTLDAFISTRTWKREHVFKPPSEEQVRRALRSPVEIDFEDTPLRDGLNYLKDYHEIQIRPDEQALTDEGISIDTPVTLKREGSSLASALDLLLTPLRADYCIDDGGLKITTMAVTNKMFSTEFYSVRHLVNAGSRVEELLETLTPRVEGQEAARGESAPPGEQPTLKLVGGNLLVVRATPRGHRQLAAALEKLRAAMRE